jgi:hypothetical protein
LAPLKGSHAVTVRTNQVALGDFFKQLLARASLINHEAVDAAKLYLTRTVVKIHHTIVKSAAAIRAGPVLEFSQLGQQGGTPLPAPWTYFTLFLA